jgi:hypothetical protein
MPLINFQTDLTSLSWGRDRRDGGSSNQPYIESEIPTGLDSDGLPFREGPDFIVRGGIVKSVSNSLEDVSRLFQMFFDFKSFNGLKFIAKENLLSRLSVKTQASEGIGYAGATPINYTNQATGVLVGGGSNINQGIYTPLSTLGQALGGFAGVHLNLLGLDPLSPMSGVPEGKLLGGSSLGLNTYDSVVGLEKKNNDASFNRLLILKGFIDEDGTKPKANLLSYSGGPGAILGIGKTHIKFADQRTGVANALNLSNPLKFQVGGLIRRSYSSEIVSNFNYALVYQNSAAAKYAQNYLRSSNNFKRQSNREFIFNDAFSTGAAIQIGANGPYQTFNYAVDGLVKEVEFYTDEDGNEQFYISEKFIINYNILYKNKSRTFDQTQIIDKTGIIQGSRAGLYPTDFRKELYTRGDLPPTTNLDNPLLGGTQTSTVLSISPNYQAKNKDVRLNMGQPGIQGGGRRGDTSKNIWNYGIKATELEALDKITAMPMYSGVGPDTDQPINDLVKFRIAAINNNRTDGSAVYMHFRAFLDSFSDSYTSNWNSVNYVGRGDTFYNYGNFDRTISLGFKVAAQSKAELIPMYKKLNFLASTLAPDYTEAGFMRGNLVRLTVGGYLYEQPGFITALTYDVPQEATWEIALNSEGGSDASVKELPHMINVSGFSFTPIHTFLPEKSNDPNNPRSKFIALSNGVNNNYNDVYRTYEPNASDGGGDNNIAT